MWGQIITDLTYNTNYQFTFPQSNSDVILNLTHWQYWWWFWFTFLLTLYFLIFIKLLRNGMMKFHPKMTTSYRAHGKWGDFIICILPISWCANILSNSNFILRLIEWQTESNLFTVRIRGKQWYWVYKLELRSMINSISAPKNLGHNYWVLFNNTNLKYTNFYINLLEMRHYGNWLESYITTYYNNHFTAINTNSNKNKFYKNWENLYLSNKQTNLTNPKLLINTKTTNTNSNKLFTGTRITSKASYYIEKEDLKILVNSYVSCKDDPITKLSLKFGYKNNFIFNSAFMLESNTNFFAKFKPRLSLTTPSNKLINWNSVFVTDINRYVRNNMFSKKNFLKLNFLENKIQLNVLTSSSFTKIKSVPDNAYLVVKQKRYEAIQNVDYENNAHNRTARILWNTRRFIQPDQLTLKIGKLNKLNTGFNSNVLKNLFTNYTAAMNTKITHNKFNVSNNHQIFFKNFIKSNVKHMLNVKKYPFLNLSFLNNQNINSNLKDVKTKNLQIKYNLYTNKLTYPNSLIKLKIRDFSFLKRVTIWAIRDSLNFTKKLDNKIVVRIKLMKIFRKASVFGSTFMAEQNKNFILKYCKTNMFFYIVSLWERPMRFNISNNVNVNKESMNKTLTLPKIFFKKNIFNYFIKSYKPLSVFNKSFLQINFKELNLKNKVNVKKNWFFKTPLILKNTSVFGLNSFNLKDWNMFNNFGKTKITFYKPNFYTTQLFTNNNLNYYLTNFTKLNLSNTSILKTNSFIDTTSYWKQESRLIYRARKAKTPSFNTINNRRLLRTGRVLVLPTNINITLITNSFDVVHSWYIPGLGVKMDCIPGRSTHHTINIDHAGFYYGQCAEICGRFHHHMPIRVCALPFEHFLMWWYYYGLPYFNNIDNKRTMFIKPGIRQYRW